MRIYTTRRIGKRNFVGMGFQPHPVVQHVARAAIAGAIGYQVGSLFPVATLTLMMVVVFGFWPNWITLLLVAGPLALSIVARLAKPKEQS
jgi:hypothetical protein